jgi:hypothetical protein
LSYHGVCARVCVCACMCACVRACTLTQYYVHGIWYHLLWLPTVYLIVFDVKMFFHLSGQ